MNRPLASSLAAAVLLLSTLSGWIGCEKDIAAGGSPLYQRAVKESVAGLKGGARDTPAAAPLIKFLRSINASTI